MCDTLKCGQTRYSFDRFCDDLTELILQYLPFADKIRLECVSKQWKRVVYGKQYSLEIDDNVGDGITYRNNSYKFPSTKLMAYYDCCELTGVTVIERLLAKCTQISHIIMGTRFHSDNMISYDQLITIIADNCHHLETIHYRIMQQIPAISTINWKYFGEKRGKTLRKIIYSGYMYCLHDMDYHTLLRFCDNSLSITNISLEQLFNDEIVLAPKLTEFTGYDCERIDLMDLFVERYRNTIESFSTSFDGRKGNLIKFIHQLSRLTELSELYLHMSGIDVHVFNENFNKIVFNCKQLNHLELELHYSNDNIELSCYRQLLNTINNCSQLTHLTLEAIDSTEEKIPNDNTPQLLLGQSLKNCANLTHLRVEMYPISDDFFADIHKYLPQLKLIVITSSYYNCLTDITMRCLAQLKQLRRIEIHGDSVITDSGVYDVLENCTQFNSLTVGVCKSITTKTIDKLIEFASKRSKITFKHFLLDPENVNLMEYIDNEKNLFPANLKIETEKIFVVY